MRTKKVKKQKGFYMVVDGKQINIDDVVEDGVNPEDPNYQHILWCNAEAYADSNDATDVFYI